MNPLAIAGAVAIGLSLGLTGAGGSILTLPVLVYFAGLPPKEAVGVSLFIVGAAALAGAIQRWRSGEFHGRAALMFGAAGMAGAAVGARFTGMVSEKALMVSFAVLMLVVAVRMLKGRTGEAEPEPDCRPGRCLVAGTGTGLLTGFIGVGGGFLLMPALMRYARLPIRTATGTSLAVISVNSMVGWLSHLPTSGGHWSVTALFAALAIVGTLAGKALSAKLPAKRLKQGFAGLVLVVGIQVLWRSVIS
ncbi:sulfite exporter TauE/SafE [Haloferula helveola]|uniref:Probable membrane transporter protein n=1 Tax=Haloferula helveola TaxID=490095 RepID=A0ABN6HCI3_9BACT|nr:sulfite exporter TauE/SafE [Haloferula helveola]